MALSNCPKHNNRLPCRVAAICPLQDSVVDREVSKPGASDFDDGEFRKNLFSYTLKVIETFPSEDREVLALTEIDGLSREELAPN